MTTNTPSKLTDKIDQYHSDNEHTSGNLADKIDQYLDNTQGKLSAKIY